MRSSGSAKSNKSVRIGLLRRGRSRLKRPYRNLWRGKQRDYDAAHSVANCRRLRRHPGQTRHRRRHLAPAVHPRHCRGRAGRQRHVSRAAIEPGERTACRRAGRCGRRSISSTAARNCGAALNLIRLAALLRRAPFPLSLDPRPHHPAGACRHARRHPQAHRARTRAAIAGSSPIPASTRAIFTTSQSIGCVALMAA